MQQTQRKQQKTHHISPHQLGTRRQLQIIPNHNQDWANVTQILAIQILHLKDIRKQFVELLKLNLAPNEAR